MTPPKKAAPEPRDPLTALWWILGEIATQDLLDVIQSVGWCLSQGSHNRDGSPSHQRPDEQTTRELGEVLVFCAERIQQEGI